MEAKKLVIFLGGEQGSGKSGSHMFLSDFLCRLGYYLPLKSVKFAGILYEIKALLDGNEPPANKVILQKLGDAVREEYGVDYMVKRTKKEILEFFDQDATPWSSSTHKALIVDDVRKALELKLSDDLKDNGIDVISIYLDAPEEVRKARLGDQWRPNTKHNTEAELEAIKKLFDHIVSTAGTIEERNEAFLCLLKSHKIEIDAKVELESTVAAFNQMFRDWENDLGHRANFRFDYDKEGRKILKIDEVSKYSEPKADMLKQHAEAVGALMPQIEPFDGSKV